LHSINTGKKQKTVIPVVGTVLKNSRFSIFLSWVSKNREWANILWKDISSPCGQDYFNFKSDKYSPCHIDPSFYL